MTHLAHKYSFKDLLEGLEEEVKKGFINWQVHPDYPHLKIYSYSNSCTFEKRWNDFTRMARGLILDVKNEKIVATPFEKFWNFQEVLGEIPNELFETFEKLDGSFCSIFYYDNKWQTATRGSFNSDQAKWAQNHLIKSLDLFKLLNAYKDATYLFEVIYKENRIVINYDYEGLVLLGGYDVNGLELDRNHLDSLGFKRPRIYQHSKIEDILEIAKTLPANDEGFVVKFQNGLRVKIKGDEYCRVHRLISNCTPLAVWESYKNCDNLEEIKKQLPEEFQIDMDNIYKLLSEKYLINLEIVEELYESTKQLSDKELGILLPTVRSDLAKFIFPCRKTNFLETIKTPSKERDKFFEVFRPKANKLEGYTPSTSINRFQQCQN